MVEVDPMKKTYVTTMPDHVGAFLNASRTFASLGLNITRVSYNKAVDVHTLFIECEGSEEQLARADVALEEIGYLKSSEIRQDVVLLEFRLRDVPGSVTEVLELIRQFNFNISFISSQENGSNYQLFKMGLFVEDSGSIQKFLDQAEKICRVRVIDYNRVEKTFDNSIFYRSYADELGRCMDLDEEKRGDLLINVNLAMQVLDEQGLSPYRTFDSIGKFAELLAKHRGNAFSPRISRHDITENTHILLIEPPCGSNTIIIRSGEETLFIDTGYACYREEMLEIFRRLLPDYDHMYKHALITHADVDHCGLLSEFDRVDMSAKSAECLSLEFSGKDGYRERNPLHKPYIRICKTLTGFMPPHPEKMNVVFGDLEERNGALYHIGSYSFGDLEFEVFEGKGGHLPGEVVLIDYEHKIAFTGDIYVNIHGMTAEQAEYNRYAPILMTSVDTDPVLCAKERAAVIQRLGVGSWQVFGAHGAKKDYDVSAAK